MSFSCQCRLTLFTVVVLQSFLTREKENNLSFLSAGLVDGCTEEGEAGAERTTGTTYLDTGCYSQSVLVVVMSCLN